MSQHFYDIPAHSYERRYYRDHLESYDLTFDEYHFSSQPQPFQMNKGSTFSTYQSFEDIFDQFIQNQMETNA